MVSQQKSSFMCLNVCHFLFCAARISVLICFFSRPGVFSLFTDSSKTHAPVVHHSESGAPALFTMEGAGFQQCVAQLTSYMHRITPVQRASLIEGLKSHTESQQTNNTTKPDFGLQRITEAKSPHATSGDATTYKSWFRHSFTTVVQWHLLILAFLGLKGLFVLLTLCSSAFCH